MSRKVLFIATPSMLPFPKSFINNFKIQGYDVEEPESLVFREQNFILKKFKNLRKRFLEDFFYRQNMLYVKKLEEFKPDFVFVFNNARVSPLFLDRCKELGVPLFLYLCDSIHFANKAFEYRHYYENIYSYEPTDASVEFRPGKLVKFIPLACDHKIYTYDAEREYKYDFCFVGSLDKRRFEMLEQVAAYCDTHNKTMRVHTKIQMDFDTRFWLWIKILSRKIRYRRKYPHLMKFIINKSIVGKDLAKLYNESRICLNIHVGTDPGMHTGPNPRTFEIMGCKGFVLVDEGHLLDLPLSNGKDVVEFCNAQDLLDKSDYYLNHESERELIAECGYRKVLERLTIEKQLKEIIEDIETNGLG